jgi:hypothetical protein
MVQDLLEYLVGSQRYSTRGCADIFLFYSVQQDVDEPSFHYFLTELLLDGCLTDLSDASYTTGD